VTKTEINSIMKVHSRRADKTIGFSLLLFKMNLLPELIYPENKEKYFEFHLRLCTYWGKHE